MFLALRFVAYLVGALVRLLALILYGPTFSNVSFSRHFKSIVIHALPVADRLDADLQYVSMCCFMRDMPDLSMRH